MRTRQGFAGGGPPAHDDVFHKSCGYRCAYLVNWLAKLPAGQRFSRHDENRAEKKQRTFSALRMRVGGRFSHAGPLVAVTRTVESLHRKMPEYRFVLDNVKSCTRQAARRAECSKGDSHER